MKKFLIPILSMALCLTITACSTDKAVNAEDNHGLTLGRKGADDGKAVGRCRCAFNAQLTSGVNPSDPKTAVRTEPNGVGPMEDNIQVAGILEDAARYGCVAALLSAGARLRYSCNIRSD